MDAAVYTPTHIHTYGLYATGSEFALVSNNPTAPVSSNWPAANDAIYIPIYLPWAYVIRRFFWVNGATVTGAISVALYTANLEAQLATTGAVAQSGASAAQYAAPSGGDKYLSPGAYMLGMSCNGTTGLVWGNTQGTVAGLRIAGLTRQGTAHPLPATPTPVAANSNLYPLCGFTKLSSGF